MLYIGKGHHIHASHIFLKCFNEEIGSIVKYVEIIYYSQSISGFKHSTKPRRVFVRKKTCQVRKHI
jgi:hypothetical protein